MFTKSASPQLVLKAAATPHGRRSGIALAVRAVAEGMLDYSTGQVINVDGGFHLRTL